MAEEVDKLAAGSVEDGLLSCMPPGARALHLTFSRASEIEGAPDDIGWVSESERDKALGLDAVWSLIIFVDGGEHTLRRASSLDALLPARAETSIG